MNARLTGVLIGVGTLGFLVAPGAAFAQDAGGNSCGGVAAVRDQSKLTGSAHY